MRYHYQLDPLLEHTTAFMNPYCPSSTHFVPSVPLTMLQKTKRHKIHQDTFRFLLNEPFPIKSWILIWVFKYFHSCYPFASFPIYQYSWMNNVMSITPAMFWTWVGTNNANCNTTPNPNKLEITMVMATPKCGINAAYKHTVANVNNAIIICVSCRKFW